MDGFGRSLNDYAFNLPETLIAQHPSVKRDESKLLIYDRAKDSISHKKFRDISDYFSSQDLLILNNSKVKPAKLVCLKIKSQVFFEIVLVQEISSRENSVDFLVLVKSSKLKIGDEFSIGEVDILRAEFLEKRGELCLFRFYCDRLELEVFVEKFGKMPLPPYIKRSISGENNDDKIRYQTIYANTLGSIASPTAGLHFTTDVLQKIKDSGAAVKFITLHVGIGTFKPIKTQNIEDHKMLAEAYEICNDTADLLLQKQKILTSVGTTSTRTLENFFISKQKIGETDLYIYPGHKFFINRLITNFHVPNSTPLMLVCAFLADWLNSQSVPDSNRESIKILKKIYAEAISKNYRFYSYGDSMFVI